MVQKINRTTYRCRLCKTIYTKVKDALECESNCLDRRDNYESVTKYGIVKIDGKKYPIQMLQQIPKFPGTLK